MVLVHVIVIVEVRRGPVAFLRCVAIQGLERAMLPDTKALISESLRVISFVSESSSNESRRHCVTSSPGGFPSGKTEH